MEKLSFYSLSLDLKTRTKIDLKTKTVPKKLFPLGTIFVFKSKTQ